MKEQIFENLQNPEVLEHLYRKNKSGFKTAFSSLPEEVNHLPIVHFWNTRLYFKEESVITKNEWMTVGLICFFLGLYAKIPDFFPAVESDSFYLRNLPFILFGGLSVYFVWSKRIALSTILPFLLIFLLSLCYIHFLPLNRDTTHLAFIHLPFFLWSILGYIYAGNDNKAKLEFLQYIGDLVVMTVIILLSGALMTGLTLGLFDLINVNITDFYVHYVIIWGLASAPVVSTFLLEKYPQMVSQVAPTIAKIFTPMVLLILSAYLVTLLYSGKDPYTDRDFLLVFNLVLIGVLALIFFSIAENNGSSFSRWVLFLLALVSFIVNAVALSAILFRITSYGWTPNRFAIFGGNLLIFIHLLWITWQLGRSLKSSIPLEGVNRVLLSYIPVYILWMMFITFFLPLIWSFK